MERSPNAPLHGCPHFGIAIGIGIAIAIEFGRTFDSDIDPDFDNAKSPQLVQHDSWVEFLAMPF
ncbi:MAG: hypothetical protein AMXMBFR82_13070 [Candidatus Hydrogenedentota bacterium]